MEELVICVFLKKKLRQDAKSDNYLPDLDKELLRKGVASFLDELNCGGWFRNTSTCGGRMRREEKNNKESIVRFGSPLMWTSAPFVRRYFTVRSIAVESGFLERALLSEKGKGKK